jgi:hypothetical protein
MPIFARRRLQAMLDDLGPRLTPAKAADLLARLEHRQTDKALAAEIELGLLWAIGQVAHLTVEPQLDGSTPDALSNDLFPSGPTIIEITALSDDTFSGDRDMNRAANIIGQFAHRVRRGANKHLYFKFRARQYFDSNGFHRDRLISSDFALTPDFKECLRAWISAPDWPNPPEIRLEDEQQNVDVLVQWKKRVNPRFRVFSSMPPIAYDLKRNPLFRALRAKGRQLRSAPSGVLRCIFVGDAGCWMLRDIGANEPTYQAKNGGQIILHFLARSSVDVVCVFSAAPGTVFFDPLGVPCLSFSGLGGPLIWGVRVFDRRQSCDENEHRKLASLADTLPPPRLEGYQARSLHRQGVFDPQARGRYVGSAIIGRSPTSMSIKVSARQLQELLAGRITLQEFEDRTFGRHTANQFEHQLKLGLTIHRVHVEEASVDQDDDHLVFDLEPDPAAAPLRKPTSKI